jgi:hypothetical protein
VEREQIDVERQQLGLVREEVLLGLTVLLAIATVAATVACAAIGLHWSVPITTGGSGIATWIASVIEGQKTNNKP